MAEIPCPYKCISDRYHMPKCYTAFEELIYAFGGPWFFGLLLLGLLVLLALVLSVARMKYVGGDDLPALVPAQHDTQINSFPFLESLNEVRYQFLPSAICESSSSLVVICATPLGLFAFQITFNVIFLSSFRLLKQIEARNLKVMCTGYISKAQILSVNLGICPIVHRSK